MPGHHWWWCYQFDAAITYFGRYVESKLHDYDIKLKKPKYQLADLLAEKSSSLRKSPIVELASLGHGIQVDRG